MNDQLAAGVVALSLLAACSTPTRNADRLFAGGDYRASQRAYERVLMERQRGVEKDRVLFQLALASLLGEGADASELPRRRLEQLILQHSQSPYRPAARALLLSLEALDQRNSELAASRAEVTAVGEELRALEAQLGSSADQAAQQEDSSRLLRGQLARTREQLERLKKQLAEREAEATRLRNELHALKLIDRASPP